MSYRRLVTQVFAVGGDLTDAEDAVQEAFVKALARGRSFVALANPEAWLRTVALNHLRNRWRHAAVVRRMQGKVPGPAEPMELGPDHVALVDALVDVQHRRSRRAHAAMACGLAAAGVVAHPQRPHALGFVHIRGAQHDRPQAVDHRPRCGRRAR